MAQELETEHLRRVMGDVSDAQLAAILALRPTVAEVEQAVAWLNKEGDKVDRAGHPLAGNISLIFDILLSDEEER